MSTETTLPPATRGEQVPVPPPDLGVCYWDEANQNGTTEYGFMPCDLTWEGGVIVGNTTQPPAPAPSAVPTQLPETGFSGTLLVLAVMLVAAGSALVRVKP